MGKHIIIIYYIGFPLSLLPFDGTGCHFNKNLILFLLLAFAAAISGLYAQEIVITL